MTIYRHGLMLIIITGVFFFIYYAYSCKNYEFAEGEA